MTRGPYLGHLKKNLNRESFVTGIIQIEEMPNPALQYVLFSIICTPGSASHISNKYCAVMLCNAI